MIQSHKVDFTPPASPPEKGPTGVFRLGCHPVLGCGVLPSALTTLLEKNSHLGIDLKLDASEEILSSIRNCHLDIGLVINPPVTPGIVCHTVFTDRLRIWKRRSGRVAPVLYFDPELREYQQIFRALGKVASRFRKHIPTSDILTTAYAVAAGDGYGILPDRVVNGFSLAPDLVSNAAFPSCDLRIALAFRDVTGSRLASLAGALATSLSESTRWSSLASEAPQLRN